MNAQKKLNNEIKKLREKYSEQETVNLIKRSGKKLFSEQKRYPNGVYVFCNSPEGGVMVGRRN